MLKLLVFLEDGEHRAIDLAAAGASIVIGRDRDLAQLVVPDSQVSRAHCVIATAPTGYTVEDLGSRNGTWLNGDQIKKSVLKPGDEVVVGGTRIAIRSGSTSGEFGSSLLGANVNGFEFKEVLGQGSYGTVYRGLQVALNRPVAIKVLDEQHRTDPAKVEAFLAEARHAGRLNHPNVVQVHDVVTADGQYFLVMELMTGGAMSDRLRIDGPIDLETCCHVLTDIGHALAYAESQRLVHRDVKPDNILVNEDGVYKLADLGIAAPISEDGLARQNRAFGSAHYVAPEQARGGSIDGRADIYGLGAALYHLVAGQPMFEGSSREIVACHINRKPAPLTDFRPEFNPTLLNLIHQMVMKDPFARPATGNELAEIAQNTLAMSSAAMATPSGVTPRRRRRRVVRRRRRR
ncbi:MAG: serine/threonine-protein kinase [Planctomycetota bacterium]|jgi:serine/threonine protein kinase|nr:serine/threonine-protein kinase [Planctomycetota bacterium]